MISVCPDTKELVELLDRQVAAARAAALEAHVDDCADCQQALERLTDCRSDETFRGLTPARETWPDPEFGQRLRSLTPPAEPRLAPGSAARPLHGQVPPVSLLRRLRVVHTICFVAFAYCLSICLVGGAAANLGLAGQLAEAAVIGGIGLPVLVGAVVFFAVSATFLWLRGSRLGERSLRWLNNCDFCIGLVLLATWHVRFLVAEPAGGFDSPDVAGFWQLYALTYALLFWSVAMVCQGLYVPQTPRRCAIMMGTILVVALGASLAAAATSPSANRAVTMLLLEQIATLGITAVMCVSSTVRLRALERAATDLGHYRLLRQLGAGGMGEVWLAEHRLLKRPCAVKLIRPDRAGEPAVLARFEREVQATAALRHPQAVEIYDYGRADDGSFYYVMEYLPGLDLDALVKRHGPLPAARVVHLLRQLCAVLRSAHAIGLIHRDLKPANVIVCPSGPPDRVKLLDFGLVLPVGRLTGSTGLTTEGVLLGTPDYMAPEQVAEGTADARTDLYSLGALAYFLLTGQAPFPRAHAMHTLLAHLRDVPEPPRQLRPDVPAELDAAILRCLAKEPAARFRDAGELDRALFQCAPAWTEEEAAAWWSDNGAPSS